MSIFAVANKINSYSLKASNIIEFTMDDLLSECVQPFEVSDYIAPLVAN